VDVRWRQISFARSGGAQEGRNNWRPGTEWKYFLCFIKEEENRVMSKNKLYDEAVRGEEGMGLMGERKGCYSASNQSKSLRYVTSVSCRRTPGREV